MSITLHPEHGVNPRIACCPRCGEDNGELLLLGTYDKKATCGHCNLTMYGAKAREKCPRCGHTDWQDWKTIEPMEKIPTSLCGACKTEFNTQAAVVAAGGVYFKCSDCNASGVIKPTEFTRRVREAGNVATPDAEGKYPQIGAEFTKANCPVCGPDKDKNTIEAPG